MPSFKRSDMKKAINMKIVAAAVMLIVALAALGLVLGIVLTDNVAQAQPDAGADVTTEADGGADDAVQTPAEDEAPAAPAEDNKGMIALAAAIAVGLAAAAGAIGMGIAVAKSNESIARQPEAKNDVRSSMMLGLVFIETAIIYALIIAILIIFVL